MIQFNNVTGCNGAPAYFWYAINIGAYVIGLVIILLYNLATKLIGHKTEPIDPTSRHVSKFQRRYIRFHVFCEELATACNLPGKVLIIILSILNQVSWTMNLYEVTRLTSSGGLYVCFHHSDLVLVWIDFFINLYFLFHFIIRFISASNKFRFMFKLSSLVDFMTVPASLYGVTQTHRRVVYLAAVPIIPSRVLNYIRALRFITYTDALVYLGILRKSRHIRFSQLIFTFLAVWCAGTGLMHLLENTGDFWSETTNAQHWTYWETNYFLLVTMSTVGYGDYYSKTILGRIFVCVFILTALAMFAAFIPEIISIVSESKLSMVEYDPCLGQAHVISCGNCDARTMELFLKGFFHPDYLSSSKLVKMVITCSEKPNLEMRAVFKHFAAWIHRFDGSVSSPKTLDMIKLQQADGVIVLSDLKVQDPDEEDNANIMRIISLKISSPETRVIVLLQHYRNKFHLLNFPFWKHTVVSPNLKLKPDLAVCMEELKMGLIAQNCLSPGASTLLVNLLINVAPEDKESTIFRRGCSKKQKTLRSWRGQYGYGAAMEIYGVTFPSQFNEIPFKLAAEICYKKWSIGLLAVDVVMISGKRRVVINPSHSNEFVMKSQSMRAFILAPDLESANQIQSFCRECHYAKDLPICNCHHLISTKDKLMESYGSIDTISESLLTFQSSTRPKLLQVNRLKDGTNEDDIEETDNPDDNARFDMTGSFHWCGPVDINTIAFNPSEAKRRFSNHFLVCLLSGGTDRSIGLCNFVMPLRFHYIAYEDLKDIVIIGRKKFIADNEWLYLQNFPKIFIVEGNPLNSAHLRAAGIRRCRHCTILTDNKNTTSDLALADKNAILCGMSVMQYMDDSDMKTTVEIVNENNVQYFSTGNSLEKDTSLSFQLTEPFSRGLVMSSSVLYSTLSSAYYSPEGLNFVLSLISGASTDVERMMGEGFGLIPEDPNKRTLRYGCHMAQRGMTEYPFNDYPNLETETPNFGQLFIWAMSTFGIFCLGLYRLRNEVSIQDSRMYYVFTYPPKETVVYSSDRVFCLIPPDTETSETAPLDTKDV